MSNLHHHQRRLLRRVHVLPALLTLGNFSCGFFAIVLCLNALYFSTRAQTLDGSGPADAETAGDGSISVATAAALALADDKTRRDVLSPRSTRQGSAGRANLMFHWACIIIFFGMAFDMLDGKVARHIGAESAFGRELDSLADITTFGVAPPVLVSTLWISVMPITASWWGQVMIFGVVYAACAALRLARYNIQSGTADKNTFSGLPSPAAAGCVASAVLLAQGDFHAVSVFCDWLAGLFDWAPNGVQMKARLLSIFMLVPGLLMVATVPFAHLANRYLGGRKSFRILVAAILALALMWHAPRLMLFIMFNGYMVVGLLVAARKKWLSRRKSAAPAGER